jgi:hypothetical protein
MNMSSEPRVRFKTPFRELAELIANTFKDHGFSYVIEPESGVELSYEILIKKDDEKIVLISVSRSDEDHTSPYVFTNILTKDPEVIKEIKKILMEAEDRIVVKKKLEAVADYLMPDLMRTLYDALSNEDYSKPVIRRVRKIINEMKKLIDDASLILGDEEIEES